MKPSSCVKHFRDVSRNFRQRARQDVDVVVAVHFQIAEFEQIVGGDRRKRVDVAAERIFLQLLPAGHQRVGDAAELVLLLEVGDLARQPRLRKLQDLDEFREFGEAAEHARAVDDELADRVHHAVEPLERNAHGFGLRQAACAAAADARARQAGDVPAASASDSRRGFGFAHFFRDLFGREFRDAREQRIDRSGHFGVARPLAMQKLFQHVHGLQAHVHDFGAGLQRAVAQAADQVLHAMRDRGKPVQAHLRGGAFYRVHRAEQAIDFVRVRIPLEREQAFGDRLQMLLGFGNEEFEHFVGDFAILREPVARTKWPGTLPESVRPYPDESAAGSLSVSGRRRRWKRECVALLERDDVGGRFRAGRADLQQVEFEHGNRVGEKFRERAVHVGRERGIHGVMKDVRHFRGHFGKFREAVARGRASERVRSDVELFEVLGPGLRLLQQARSTPADTGGSRKPPGGTARLIPDWARSQGSLHQSGRASRLHCARLAINPAIAKHHRLEFHGHVRQRLRMAQQKIAAGLERVVKAAQNRQAPLFGKIHQHVHAEDAVDLADVNRFGPDSSARKKSCGGCAASPDSRASSP